MAAVLVAQLGVFGVDLERSAHAFAGDHFEGLSFERVEPFQHSRRVDVAAERVELLQQLTAVIDARDLQPV